jgi:hypothetical protein
MTDPDNSSTEQTEPARQEGIVVKLPESQQNRSHKEESAQRKWGRRDVLKVAGVAVISVTPAGMAVTGMPSFLDAFARFIKHGKDNDELRKLREVYLWPLHKNGVEARVPLVPPLADPWGPRNRQFSGSGNTVAAAYASAFSQDKHIYSRTKGPIRVSDDDAPVLIASHLVSEPAQRYFGKPESAPNHSIRCDDSRGGFTASLRWAIYTPELAEVKKKLELFEGKLGPRFEPVHHLSDLDGPDLAPADFTPQGRYDYQRNDHFLITVLPRDSRFDRRVVSLAGVLKPGTLAAAQFLTNDNLALKPLKEIHEKVRGCLYYQALIRVDVKHDPSEGPVPTQLELVDAVPIHVVAYDLGI